MLDLPSQSRTELQKMQNWNTRMPVRSFRDLDAWNEAMKLAVARYRMATRLPQEERFELSAQIRSAAVSVPSNVAEGFATGSDGLFARHVRFSLGSVAELETQMELAARVSFLSRDDVDELQQQMNRTNQVLHGLARSIRARRLKKLGRVCAVLMAILFVTL
jgi:four helix bundle protein